MPGIPETMEQEDGQDEEKGCECCDAGRCMGWKTVTRKKGRKLGIEPLRLCAGELNLVNDRRNSGVIQKGGITGWRKEDMYVDSGATDPVCPKEFSPTHEIPETRESKSGNFTKQHTTARSGCTEARRLKE